MKRIGAWMVTTALALGTSGLALAGDGSKVAMPLVSSGLDADASAKAEFRSSRGKSQFKVRVRHAESGQSLHLRVGGIDQHALVANGAGSASFSFKNPPSSRDANLDFDPRGREIEVENETGDDLLNNLGGGNPAGTQIDERVTLGPTGAIPGASGHARYRERKGKQNFSVEVEDVPDGSYDVLLDGIVVGSIRVSLGHGEFEVEGGGDDGPPLPYDPYGKLVQVAQGSTVVVAATLLAGAPGLNVCTPSETTTDLGNVGPDLDASGDVRFRVKADCEQNFSAEIEDAPVGAYELWVGGVLRGTISVVDTGLKIEGELEFSSDPDDVGELLLDFDPVGQTVEIKQGATTFLAGVANSGGGGTCDLIDTGDISMTSSGVDGNAKGKARLRQDVGCDQDLRVQIENVPVGAYDLVVGGIVRGTITVALVSGEEVGEIEFDSSPDQPGELLLTFDPRGQAVEAKQGATLFLSVALPN